MPSVPSRPSGMSRLGFLVSSPRLATASKPLYAKKTTAAATKTPTIPKAVGVVPVERSGMASGVNSTFRQVGIATGIAALGSLFSHQVTQGVRDGLAGTPAAAQSSGIAEAVTSGQIQAVLAQAPAAVRDQLAAVATSSFVDALNHIIVIGAVIAYVAGAACLVLIRQKDFVPQGPPRPQQSGEGEPAVGAGSR